MSISLVVFDMAGTTVKDDDAVHRSLQFALEGAGVKAQRDEVNAVMGMPKPIAIRSLMQLKRGVAPKEDEVKAAYQEFVRHMVSFYENDPAVREIPGATPLFLELKEQGIQVALDTGFSRVILDAILRRLNWDMPGLIDATVASDEVAQGRPHPDLIFEAMRRTGVARADQVAKVGDTPSDLQEGKAAGCRYIIGSTYGSHTRAELEKEPHTHLIKQLSEVAAIVAAS